jgi:hypothetical protein
MLVARTKLPLSNGPAAAGASEKSRLSPSSPTPGGDLSWVAAEVEEARQGKMGAADVKAALAAIRGRVVASLPEKVADDRCASCRGGARAGRQGVRTASTGMAGWASQLPAVGQSVISLPALLQKASACCLAGCCCRIRQIEIQEGFYPRAEVEAAAAEVLCALMMCSFIVGCSRMCEG